MSQKKILLSKIILGYSTQSENRIDTATAKKSFCKLFLDFLSLTEDKPPQKFSRRDAMTFLEWYRLRGVKNISYNTIVVRAKTQFQNMLLDGYINENPFAMVKKKKVEKTDKRNLTNDEITIICKYLSKNDKWLFYAFLLQYYCFVRPSEMCKIKIKDFDFDAGSIFIRDEVAKKTGGWVTIPNTIIDVFSEIKIINSDFYLFGAYFKPNKERPLNRSTLGKHFNLVIKKMQKLGLLGEMNNVTWYRVKHTGITDMANDPTISIFKTSLQARHKNIKTTMIYYTPAKVNDEIKNYQKRIFE